MRLDPEASYFMPVSVPQRPIKAGVFEDVTFILASYETEKDAIAALLPEPFEPDDNAIVTVYYAKCPQVNFLAGHGYNMIGVDLAAFFNGKQDQLRGSFGLVLWEDKMNPVTRGRELLGVPKLLAEVPDFTCQGNLWHGQASENGNLLIDVTVGPANECSEEQVAAANDSLQENHWMCWKYIPNIDGQGAAVSQPTLIGRQVTVNKSWEGQGRFTYGSTTWEENQWNSDIVDALKLLPVKEYVGGVVNNGSMTITRALNRVLV